MSRIKIKNFGPIQDGCRESDGWIEISKTTIFIGNQGSGKSTVAKLISTFTWIEKALVRGDYDKKWFERKNRLKNQFLNYHRLENYQINNRKTEIDYEGDAYQFQPAYNFNTEVEVSYLGDFYDPVYEKYDNTFLDNCYYEVIDSVSQTIGPEGGELAIGNILQSIPPDAVSEETEFTIPAPALTRKI